MALSSLKGSLIACDTETTGLNPWNSEVYKIYGMSPARPFAFSFCDAFGNTAFIRWEVNPKTREVIPNKKELNQMSELLSDPSIVKVGHNLLFDIRMILKSGIKFNWKYIHDTLFLTHIITGGGLNSYGLKPLCESTGIMSADDEDALIKSVTKGRSKGRKLGWNLARKETHGMGYTKSDYWVADKNLLKEYAINDAERAMIVYLGAMQKLKEQPKLEKIYRNMEMPLAKVVYRIEDNGMRVFPEKMKPLKKFYLDYANKWRAKADKLGGKGMNFNSSKQLVEKFCIEKGYKTLKTTKAGNPSIDAAELLRLSTKDELAKAILECKSAEAMDTKFLKSYTRFMAKRGSNYLVHPNFNQCGCRTTRFSSSNPNLQQVASPDSIKKKAEIALKPREAFGPIPNHSWLLFDFSQMEVWVFAFLAKDKAIMTALLEGRDIHDSIGKQVWGHRKDYKTNRKMYRKKGKTMMFLKQYGGGPKAASGLMDCSWEEAKEAIDDFNNRLPGVDNFILTMCAKAEEHGYIEDPFGRQYFIDREFSYKAVNYLVQGTCAGIMKRAMIKLDKLFNRKYKRKAKIVCTIHDELIIQVPKRLITKQFTDDVIRVMQKDSKIVGIPTAIPVSINIANDTWANAHELEIDRG